MTYALLNITFFIYNFSEKLFILYETLTPIVVDYLRVASSAEVIHS